MHTDFATGFMPIAPLPDPRHRIKLVGGCSIENGPDTACTAVEVSATSLTLETQAAVKFLDAVILNLPQLGILEAVVADVFEGGFEVNFDPAPESKLGIFVSWLEGTAAGDEVDREARGFPRLVPIKRLTVLHREGELPSMARIIDLSRSGVAFTTSKTLARGERVAVGAFAGDVVRLTEGGAAVRFDRLVDERDFDVLIDLDAAVATS